MWPVVFYHQGFYDGPMAKKAAASKTKTSPRKRDREATENKLLKAGLEVFSKIGFDAATTQMVAKKAGVNEALISRYFKGKSGLLAAIIIAFIKEAELITIKGYPAGKTFEEEIKNFMVFHFEHDLKNRDFLRVAISRSAVDAKLRKEVDKHVPVDGHPFLAQRLEVFKERGEIDPELDLMQISRVICNQCMGLMFTACLIGSIKTEDLYQTLELSAQTCARGIQAR